MPDIYVRTGPFDTPPAQGSLGDGSDPWAAFPDAPPTDGNAGDPWAAFPDAPTTHTPTHGSDPWAAFPDWPPIQAQQGGDLFAAFPDAPPRSLVFQSPPESAINPAATARFNPMQPLLNNALRQADVTGGGPSIPRLLEFPL